MGEEQAFWKCGRCGANNSHLKTEQPSDTCDSCGYKGHTRNHTSLPPQIRVDLTQY